MKVTFKNDSNWKGSIKYYILSFYHNDRDLLNIDRSGRIISFISKIGTPQKVTYKRAFNGSWLGIDRSQDMKSRTSYQLSYDEIISLYKDIELFISSLIEKLREFQNIDVSFDPTDVYSAVPIQPTIEFWIKILKHVSLAQNNEDRDSFYSIYSNVSILPPDRYGSLVLQVTTGCVYNKCSFCTLYAEIPYAHKSSDEFKDHTLKVNLFMKESLGRFHSIFIGDANALTIPYPDLLEIFKIINQTYKIKKTKENFFQKCEASFEGIYSFLDVFTGFKLTTQHFKQLATLNLRTVYLGIETGSSIVLKLLNKPNTRSKIIHLINSLHEAHIGVAVIFLIGAGGKQFEEEHITESINLIQQMNLNSKDIVYFSKLVISGNYEAITKEKNIESLTEQELEAQFKILKRRLDNFYDSQKTGPIITRYELLSFIY